MISKLPARGRLVCLADEEGKALALHYLRAGRLVALPTDTVYGVASHGLLPRAILRLYRAKDRPRERAIPALIGELEHLSWVADDPPTVALALAESFWPGGLTMVLRKKQHVPAELTSGGESVAVRLPDHPVPRDLCRALNAPLAATSANRSGEPEAGTPEEVEAALGRHLHLILDGGASPGGTPSTVVDLTGEVPRLLRPGPITREALAMLLPELEVG
ncbi:MAG: L-threonylcarbamoyladenylate synthase [Anaerolineae bacterium]